MDFDDDHKKEEPLERASEVASEETTLLSSELNSDFLDNTYWRIGDEQQQAVDIDELFAELEGY